MPAPAARQGTVPGLIARNNQEKYQPKKKRIEESEGGRVSPKKATHGIGTAITSDKRKKPLNPVIDKRTVKQKLKDAQARSN